MNSVNKPLLTDLRDALLSLPEDPREAWTLGFDMRYWGRTPTNAKLGCGIVCCAFTLGTALPSWKEAGLKLTSKGQPEAFAREVLGLNIQQWEHIFHITPYKGNYNDAHAVAARIGNVLGN